MNKPQECIIELYEEITANSNFSMTCIQKVHFVLRLYFSKPRETLKSHENTLYSRSNWIRVDDLVIFFNVVSLALISQRHF